MKERERWLDVTKGIGALLVILSHDWFFPDFIGNFLDSFFMPLFLIGRGGIYGYNKCSTP